MLGPAERVLEVPMRLYSKRSGIVNDVVDHFARNSHQIKMYLFRISGRPALISLQLASVRGRLA